MDSLKALFDRFILERKYLKNITVATEYSYHNAANAFFKIYGPDLPLKDLSKDQLSARIVSMRQRGMSPGGCNVYIRTANAFLRWLHEEGIAPVRIKIPLLKQEQKLLKPLTPDQVQRFVRWKPKHLSEKRLHALILLLLDTGMRIREALTLRKDGVDLDNLLITVLGKGSKERIIPMSPDLRKVLYRRISQDDYPLVFCTSRGASLTQRNVLRDMKLLAKRLGVSGVRVSPHTLRHTFALAFVRNGGDVFSLQRMLGHSTLEMTRRYVNMQTEDLQRSHRRYAGLLAL